MERRASASSVPRFALAAQPGTLHAMARAIWSGAISFGLVNIPVKLYSAARKKSVRFHQLDGADNSRIQQKRVNANTGEEVPYEQLVAIRTFENVLVMETLLFGDEVVPPSDLGELPAVEELKAAKREVDMARQLIESLSAEFDPDRYVVVRPEELESVEPKKTRTIDIEDFVELDQIDPIYYDHPYYLAPAEGAAKAYALLLQALKDSGKVGIARVVIRSKEQLVAIRTFENVLVMETLLFGDEVVPASDLGELPAVEELKAGKREVEMARQLIESLSADFEPDRYRDEYRQSVLELIERKAEGHDVAIQSAPEAPEEVPDLMAALEASIASAKGQSGGSKDAAKAKPRAKRSAGAAGNGSKPSGKPSGGKSPAGAKGSAKKSKSSAAKK